MRLRVGLLVCLALAGCTASQAATEPVLLPVEEREAAPAVVGDTVDGRRLALADLDGPVIVNFWASWCGPCVAEAPELAAIAETYEGRVHVVGVNVKDNITNARRFETELDIGFPSWFDPAATIAADFGGLGPAALPSTIVLDDEHRVAVRFFGAVTATRLHNYLEPMLAEGG